MQIAILRYIIYTFELIAKNRNPVSRLFLEKIDYSFGNRFLNSNKSLNTEFYISNNLLINQKQRIR